MAETYSLAITGYSSYGTTAVNVTKTLTVGDSGVNAPGQEQQAMSQNRQVLCKNQDGSQSWYTYDTERSIPGALRVMRRV